MATGPAPPVLSSSTNTPDSFVHKRGFASMDKAKHREIARKGGKRAHASGNAHRYTREEARKAGAKGARALLAKHGAAHMSAIGRIGGRNSKRKKNEETPRTFHGSHEAAIAETTPL